MRHQRHGWPGPLITILVSILLWRMIYLLWSIL